VRLVRSWAAKGGPFPRCQELPDDGILVGSPPAGLRKFVVSHGWASEVHPSPSGAKMRLLAEALDRQEARDEDVVFFDFCSAAQEDKMGNLYEENVPWTGAPQRDATAGPYFAHNNVGLPLAGRTPEQKEQFKYALWDVNRLCCFQECDVIVLPQLELADTWPGGRVWGVENPTPYQNRGWCVAEFAIALYSGRIKNLDDDPVKKVFASREWPSGGTVGSCQMYADIMKLTTDRDEAVRDGLKYDDTKGIRFTSKGDRGAVKWNFFKMTMKAADIGL